MMQFPNEKRRKSVKIPISHILDTEDDRIEEIEVLELSDDSSESQYDDSIEKKP